MALSLTENYKCATLFQIGTAKNVILFLGDGMGVSTVTAARFYNAELKGLKPADNPLVFERFPSTGLSKVLLVLGKVYHRLTLS